MVGGDSASPMEMQMPKQDQGKPPAPIVPVTKTPSTQQKSNPPPPDRVTAVVKGDLSPRQRE